MELQTKEEKELEKEIHVIAKKMRDLKMEELSRLTKLFLKNELHKKKQKESMFTILCMVLGEDDAKKK